MAQIRDVRTERLAALAKFVPCFSRVRQAAGRTGGNNRRRQRAGAASFEFPSRLPGAPQRQSNLPGRDEGGWPECTAAGRCETNTRAAPLPKINKPFNSHQAASW